MEKLMNKKTLPIILLVGGIIAIAVAFFLMKDDPVEPEPKPDDGTETPIVPDDGDIIIPINPDDPDYISPDPSDPIEPDDDDTTPPEDDPEPEDTSGFPKPGDGDDEEQEDEDEVSDSDWQTFHNEGYKFEISYPADTHTLSADLPETKAFYINVKDDPEYIEGIFIKLADAAGSADDVIERVEEDNKNDVFSEILEDEVVYLFNIKVRKITATSPRGFHSSHYFFSRNGINYELIVNDEDDLCEEIISSFKVIN